MLYVNGEFVWIPAAGILDAFSFAIVSDNDVQLCIYLATMHVF